MKLNGNFFSPCTALLNEEGAKRVLLFGSEIGFSIRFIGGDNFLASDHKHFSFISAYQRRMIFLIIAIFSFQGHKLILRNAYDGGQGHLTVNYSVEFC